MKTLFFTLGVILFWSIGSPVFASAWPATDATGTDIGGAWRTADSSIEPSGAVWSEYENTFVAVSDEGQVALIATDGTLNDHWDLGGGYDLEDVTIIDSTTALVYLLDENNTTVREFDTDSGALTGKYWDASGTITEDSGGSGAEGLTWVPDGYSSIASGTSGGHFYIGWQTDGDVYVFNVDLATSGTATFVEEVHMTSGYTDIAGLFWSSDTERFYALYDGLNLLEERDADGVLMASYDLPVGSDQEGVAFVQASTTTATMVITEDVSGRVMSYAGYPIVLADPDADADGARASADCDDTDSSVSVESVYYADVDSDTLGDPAASTSVCAGVIPAGYVANSDDTNDAISNYGIEIDDDLIDNDFDGDIDEVNKVRENGVHPHYSTLAPADTTLFGSSILRVSGMRNGQYRVRYSDNSVYVYRAFNNRTVPQTQKKVIAGSGYVLVKNAGRSAIVNALTGEILDVRYTPRTRVRTAAWVLTTTGLTL